MSQTTVQIEADRQKQMRAAEELLFTGPQQLGVAKGLFLGRFVANWVMPYPSVRPEEQIELDDSLKRLRAFLDEHLDPVAIDRQANIPRRKRSADGVFRRWPTAASWRRSAVAAPPLRFSSTSSIPSA